MNNILLVEDDKVQAGATKDFLESHGFDVIWADDGKGAIKIAETEPIDLILLDFILPDMSGDEVCRFLKQMDDTKAIPVIALTIKSSMEDKVAGLLAGIGVSRVGKIGEVGFGP